METKMVTSIKEVTMVISMEMKIKEITMVM